MSTWGGRRTSMARTISDHRPDWVPGASPSLAPALEMSVQGKPPHRRSMGLTPQRTRDQLMRRTSPRLGTPGQWWARTAFAAWSVSQCQTTVPPVACSTARSSTPLPENMEPIRMLHFATLRRRPHRSYLSPESRGSWVRLYRAKTGQKTGISMQAACSRLMVGIPHKSLSHTGPALSIPTTSDVS